VSVKPFRLVLGKGGGGHLSRDDAVCGGEIRAGLSGEGIARVNRPTGDDSRGKAGDWQSPG